VEQNELRFSEWGTLADGLRDAGWVDEEGIALERCQSILEERGHRFAEVYNRLGMVRARQHRFADAIVYYRKALEVEPGQAHVYSNLAAALAERGSRRSDWQEAVDCYRQALVLQPESPAIRVNLSHLLLSLGQFEEGWQEYQWRRFREGGPQNQQRLEMGDVPLWDGRELPGQTILLLTEQGSGDTLQFIRYAPLVAARAARVVVVCSWPLGALLARVDGVAQVVMERDRSRWPEHHAYAPLPCLPRIFRQYTLETLPPAPYLSVPPELCTAWRERLEAMIRAPSSRVLKVGLVWAGNPAHGRDALRSIQDVQVLQPLLQVPDVAFFSLQMGVAAQQVTQFDAPSLHDLGTGMNAGEQSGQWDFMASAAVVASLDLLITVDSAPAHLAGGMGCPVWLLLPFVAEWRWLLDRADSPWYPTMRLFRQTRPKDWNSVVTRLVAALTGYVNRWKEQQGMADRTVTGVDVVGALEQLAAGDARKGERDYPGAIACYTRAVALDPGLDEGYFRLGTLHHALGKHEEAKGYYRQAVAANPSHTSAYNNLGVLLAGDRQFAEAAQCYEAALQVTPDSPELWSNLGVVLTDQRRFEEAHAAYQRALTLNPGYAEGYNNLGNLFKAQQRFDEAIEQFARCLHMKPTYHEAFNNLGTTFSEMLDLRRAVASYRKSLSIKSDYVEAHNNLANNLLMLGQFAEGWQEYQWRRLIPSYRGMLYDVFQSKPVWDGAPLHGKEILLLAEQGFGDAMQFARYVPLVAARGGRVILACQPPLQALLARIPGVAQVVNQRGPWPGFHEYAPLLCLPRVFQHHDENRFPHEVPYLSVAPEWVAKWRPRIPETGRLRVAIVWSGSPTHGRDHLRSIPLAQWRPVLEVPGIDFYSIQMGAASGVLHGSGADFGAPIVDLSPDIADFSDTAAILVQMDLLISIDSSPIHLAGALGRSVWSLITFMPDWRWMLERRDNPWYPTMRLFRQSRPSGWEDVILQVAGELAGLAGVGGSSDTGAQVSGVVEVPLPSSPPSPSPVPPPVLATGKRLVVGWQMSQLHGWGLYGLNLVFTLLRMGGEPILLQPPVAVTLNPLQQRALQPVLDRCKPYMDQLGEHPQSVLRDPSAAVLVASDHRLNWMHPRFEGGATIGITFFENPNLPEESIRKSRELPLIVAGSSWNEQILREMHGLTNVRTIIQGVDTGLFYPVPEGTGSTLLPGRFVVFGGGKLEHRKGQDLVIEAFRAFHSRHPEAFLLTAWHNHWSHVPGMRKQFAFRSSHYVTDLPTSPDLNPWLAQYLPADSFHDVGSVSNPLIPPLLRDVDVAVLPSRCEGGTNLVAMECMATGVPVILSANTGHLDLTGPDRCYTLNRQGPVHDPDGVLLPGWGESSVDEIVERLEEVWQNREEARRRGLNGHRFLSRISWHQQCERVIQAALSLV
jgi:tetratricopeptide (TPR) repeat protein/glycosyltransferase involved in cell wall biosynthesis